MREQIGMACEYHTMLCQYEANKAKQTRQSKQGKAEALESAIPAHRLARWSRIVQYASAHNNFLALLTMPLCCLLYSLQQFLLPATTIIALV
jgi:hypothetical protein